MRLFIVILLSLFSALHAQTTGELRGVVKDGSDSAVKGAKVTAKSGGAARNLETEADGQFVFTSLPVGEYSVEIEADGFKSYVRQYIQVSIGRVIEISARLEPGESTKVLAMETPLVERSSTQIGTVVGRRSVVGLPLNTRDTYQLLQLQPGVQSQQGYDLFAGSDKPGVVSVNGGRSRANNYNVNGGDANDLFIGVPGVQPAPDTIEEFRVLTTGFDAEYGRNSGSQVNVVTRSGSEAFHGSLYEFFRNRALNTRGFFDAERSKFNQNQFGGTLGGPLRSNAFFFVSAESRRIRQGISSDLVSVPTADEREGNFSAGAPFSGVLQDQFLGDSIAARPGCATALSGAPIEAGTPWASIFPGNRIPPECFDATAAALLKEYIPLPNRGTNVFQSSPANRENAIQPTLRLDYAFGPASLLSFYYYLDDSSLQNPFSRFQGTGATLPGFGSNFLSRSQQANLSHVSSFGASVVNEARFTFFRLGQLQYNHPQRTQSIRNVCGALAPGACFSDPADPRLGITPDLGAEREGLPYIQLSGGFTIGNNQQGELPQAGNSFQWSDSVSLVRGRHRMKFGADLRRLRFDQTLFYDTNGSFVFAPGAPNTLGGDNVIPDYLLGIPSVYAQGSAQGENVRSTAISLFAQDGWNLGGHVSLNYGLRWELTTPMRDSKNRIQTFRPGEATRTFPCRLEASNPLAETFGSTDCNPGSPGESVFPLGLVVPGDPGVQVGLTATYYRAFAPRLGLAWSPSPKTSIRASWGMFYNPMEQLVLEQFSAQPPFGGSTSLTNTMFNTPFLGQDGSIYSNPFHGVLSPKPGDAIDWSAFRPILLYGSFQPRMRPQYSANFNLTVQHQFRRDLLLQVGYVGSQGRRLLATRDLNYGQAQPCLDLNRLSSLVGNPSLACGAFGADAAYHIAANELPAGFTLRLPYGPVGEVTGPNPEPITLVGLRRYSSPFCNPLTGSGCPADGVPVFSSIFAEDTIANSSYHALQIGLEKRAFAGLQFQAAYTFSKSIDNASSFENLLNPLDYSLSRSLSYFDARHRLAFSFHWELPKLGGRSGLGAILNGWAVSGILALQSGFPVPITSSDDLELMSSSFFSYPGEPDRIAPLRKLNPRGPMNLAFDPSSFRQPEDLGRIGTSPRTVCCGPGINNFDFALMKNAAVRENMTLQFRAELFNVANHAQFTKVDGNISDGDPAAGGTFGMVQRARDPRLAQLALKVLF